jgi:hypothetical protein
VITLLHDVVGDTFDTYGQITLPDVQTRVWGAIATRVAALTQRRPGMLYRSHEGDALGAVQWKIPTECEDEKTTFRTKFLGCPSFPHRGK